MRLSLQGPQLAGPFEHLVFVTAASNVDWRWTVAIKGVAVQPPGCLPPGIMIDDQPNSGTAANQFTVDVTATSNAGVESTWEAVCGLDGEHPIPIKAVAVRQLRDPSVRLVLALSPENVAWISAQPMRRTVATIRCVRAGIAAPLVIQVR